MAASIPSAEAVVLILTSCTAGPAGRPGWSEIHHRATRFAAPHPTHLGHRQIEDALGHGLGERPGACANGGLGPPRPPGARAAASAAVHEQAVDRVWYRVERGLNSRK